MSTQIFLNNAGQSVRLFAQTTSSSPVGGAIQSGSLLGSGVGTLTVPANTFQVGDSFKLTMGGHLDALNGKKLEISVAATGVPLATTGQITMPNCTSQHWNLEITFTIRAIGAAGVASIASNGYFLFTKNAATSFEGENFSLIESTSFSTTVNNTLQIKAAWDTPDVGNSIYSETGVLTRIY